MINRKIIVAASITAVVLLGAGITVYISHMASRSLRGSLLEGKNAGPGQVTSEARPSDMFQTAAGQQSDVSEGVSGIEAAQAGNTHDGSEPVDEPQTDGKGQVDALTGNDGHVPEKEVKTIKAKALYLTGSTAGNEASLDHFIKLMNTTELNALVIDIKEAGIVNYESDVPMVRENGLYRKVYDAEKILKKLHDNNIFVIGRIVCFRDDGLARKRPDLAVKRPDGSLWREGKMGAWLNPYMEETWKYNIDIAKEAVKKGFDEIQFDYVRFPTAKKKDVDYGENPPEKADAIGGFLKLAAQELRDGLGVPVSADVFGIIAESPVDGKALGQEIGKVGLDIDYICPMIYPSHYANASPSGYMANGKGQTVNGVLFTHPDLKPYEVVYNTLIGIKNKISQIEGYRAKIRPYLQDFTAAYLPDGYYQTYGPEQIRQQIEAVYDAGFEEWIFWDAGNTYTESALIKE